MRSFNFVVFARFFKELEPDAEKQYERLLTNQETPEFSPVILMEDAVRILSTLQRFCIDQHGFNDHYLYATMCNMRVSELEPSIGMRYVHVTDGTFGCSRPECTNSPRAK